MRQTDTYSQHLRAMRRMKTDGLEEYVTDMTKAEQLLASLRHKLPYRTGFFIISYALNRYIYGDEQFAYFSGLSQSELTLHSATSIRKVNPSDSRIFEERVWSDRRKFFTSNNIPIADYPNYRMRCTYRLQVSPNALVNVMQENYYLKTTERGLPLISIGAITDISDIRNDNCMVNTIFKGNETVSRARYYVLDENDVRPLTKREEEIAGCIFDGMTNAEIAERLHCSKSTVDTHRENIYRKLGCTNVADLVKLMLGGGLDNIK
jgi:DNA-binding CsgD family transcriptional regulator